MLARRLDDRIRELSALIATTPDADLEPILKELQSAIHEKIELLRKAAAKHLIRIQRHNIKERRSGDG